MGLKDELQEMSTSKHFQVLTLRDRLGECLKASAAWVESINRANGWYDEGRTFGEDVALLHSEVSEMLEAYREWGTRSMIKLPSSGTVPIDDLGEVASAEMVSMRAEGKVPKPEGIGSEAADVLVRLLDTCSRYDIDLGAEFYRKVSYNATRSYRHGGKTL